MWFSCILERAAKDQEELERWQSDEVAHIKGRFIVRHIPDDLKPLVEEAVNQWHSIEKEIFPTEIEKERFMKEFEEARSDLLSGGEGWKLFASKYGAVVYGKVRNMDWVNLFSWILPKAIPGESVRFKEIGRIVTSLFYTEIMFKSKNSPNIRGNKLFQKIEARWKLVSE